MLRPLYRGASPLHNCDRLSMTGTPKEDWEDRRGLVGDVLFRFACHRRDPARRRHRLKTSPHGRTCALLPGSSRPIVAIELLGWDGRFWDMEISARPAEMGRVAVGLRPTPLWPCGAGQKCDAVPKARAPITSVPWKPEAWFPVNAGGAASGDFDYGGKGASRLGSIALD